MWMVVLLLAACSAPGELAPEETPPTGASDLVLRVVDTGGLLGPGSEFRLPALSLYGDGLLVLPGKPVVHRRLTMAGVRRVVQMAIRAGLTREQDFGTPRIADAPVTIITVVTSRRFKTKIVAPFDLGGDSAAQAEARKRVHVFRKALNDLESWLGDDIGPAIAPPPGPHLVFSYKIPPTHPGGSQEWPYGDLMTAGQAHSVGRCQVLPAERVRALPNPVPAQPWRYGNDLFVLVFRPLLPDERSCEDIKRIG